MSIGRHRSRKNKTLERTGSSQWNALAYEERFNDDVEVAQLDLVTDLNDEFFNISYELVQRLVPLNNFVAGKMKRYVDILARMHSHYVVEVTAIASMHDKVREAEEKLQLAIETTANSNDMMERLKEDLAEAWRTADAVHSREVMAGSQTDNQGYHDQRSKHTENIGEGHPQELRIRGVVYRERDRLARELKDYQKRLETNRFYSTSLEALIDDHRSTITKQQIRVKLMEAEVYKIENKNRTHMEGLEETIIQQRKHLESMSTEILDLRTIEKKFIETVTMNENQKQQIERLTHENYALQKSYHRHESEKYLCKMLVKNLENANRVLRREKDDLDAIYRTTMREMKKKSETFALLNRRFMQLAKKYTDLTEQELLLNNELSVINRKLSITTAKLEEITRQKDDVERGREKLRGEITMLNDGMASLKYDLVVQRNRMHDVQLNLDRALKMLEDKDQTVHRLNKEKNDLALETNELSKTIETLEEKMAKKTEKLVTLQEQMQNKQLEYLNAKKQMEIVHSEKTILQKSYEVCGRDRQNLQNINTKLSFQTNQLCNQLSLNEKDIAQLKNQIDQLNSTIKHKLSEIHSKERLLHRMHNDLNEKKIHNEQLQHTIEEDEKRFKSISCSLDEVRKEKTLVGQQMVRRNGELRVQREKLSMMQLALNRGTLQYNQRIEDIRLLKTEITNLTMSNECLKRAVAGTANMRHEVVRLERQLNRERLHVTAFMEEMKHPYRIHRWRVMLGKDPLKYELIRKIQILLKRNIRLNVQRVNSEKRVEEVQQLYDMLKKQIQHMPDPSIKEKLWFQQRINQRQSRKLRAMKAELAINEIDLESRDSLIEQFQQAIRTGQPDVIINQKNRSKSLKCIEDKYTEQVFQITPPITETCSKDQTSCSS